MPPSRHYRYLAFHCLPAQPFLFPLASRSDFHIRLSPAFLHIPSFAAFLYWSILSGLSANKDLACERSWVVRSDD